jgi:hypothetical protein
MAETKAELNLALVYLNPTGPDEEDMSRIKLIELYVRMKHGDYVFKSHTVEKLAQRLFEKDEKDKAEVRSLKKTVMSELGAIPGGPKFEEAKARFEGKGPGGPGGPGGRRTAIRKRKARKARKTRKSRK